MEEIGAVLQGLDWSPLYISLKTGAVATIISFFLGLFAARKVIKAGPKVKAVAGWAAYASHGAAAYSGGLLPSSPVQQKKAAWHLPV